MAYDDQIDNKQGSIKSSEVFLDRALDIIKNEVGDTGLRTFEGIMKPLADALRYNNFLLHSDGQIFWDDDGLTTKIKFDSDGKANNIIVRLMMMDENAASQTVDVRIEGTTGANGLAVFNEIELSNNELVYLEISRDLLLAATPPAPGQPGELILENGIDGGSVAIGQRVLKATLTESSGLPRMIADMNEANQTNSQTVNIPLAARFDWSDGIDTYRDVWWIPHGIRWPSGSRSVLGAVVVSGFDALPDYFVRNQLELQQALTDLNNTGGIITPIAEFTITSPISFGKGITMMGKTNRTDPSQPSSAITFDTGGYFNFDEGSGIQNVAIKLAAGFGGSGAESALVLSGKRSFVKDCSIEVEDAGSTDASCVECNSDMTRIEGNRFSSAVSSAIAINQTLGTSNNNHWSFNDFDSITETSYANESRSVGVRSDYGMVPLGSIIPWMGASFTNGSNGGASALSGAGTIAGLKTYLSDGWAVCDGTELPDNSPLKRGGNIYTPQITDSRFLRGSTGIGTTGGSSTTSLGISNLPSHNHSVTVSSHNVTGSTPVASSTHTHNNDHVHQWSYWDNNAGRGMWVLNQSGFNISQFGLDTWTTFGTGVTKWVSNAGAGTGGAGGILAVAPGLNTFYTGKQLKSASGVPTGNPNTGAPSSTTNVTVSIADHTTTVSSVGSGTSFNNEPQYMNTFYIMRVK